MKYKLKRLGEQGLDHAWKKAEKYRDLNQPEEAESICRDILDVAPQHQAALRTLGLALTDLYPGHWQKLHAEAMATFARLDSEYERTYYTGIAWERCAKSQLDEGSGRAAYDAFVQALGFFERAGGLASDSEPDPVLRWNRCVRALSTNPLLLAAAAGPHSSDIDFGDGPPNS
jgi:hypothetical protein